MCWTQFSVNFAWVRKGVVTTTTATRGARRAQGPQSTEEEYTTEGVEKDLAQWRLESLTFQHRVYSPICISTYFCILSFLLDGAGRTRIVGVSLAFISNSVAFWVD